MANAGFSLRQNAITSIRTYIEETGGWINTSDNINGNWTANAGFGFNTALRNKKFNIGTHTNISFNNNVGYLTIRLLILQKLRFVRLLVIARIRLTERV